MELLEVHYFGQDRLASFSLPEGSRKRGEVMLYLRPDKAQVRFLSRMGAPGRNHCQPTEFP
jgi:hypothetical protein